MPTGLMRSLLVAGAILALAGGILSSRNVRVPSSSTVPGVVSSAPDGTPVSPTPGADATATPSPPPSDTPPLVPPSDVTPDPSILGAGSGQGADTEDQGDAGDENGGEQAPDQAAPAPDGSDGSGQSDGG